MYCILSSGPKRGKLNRRKTASGGQGYGGWVDGALCLGPCIADFRQKPLQKCRVRSRGTVCIHSHLLHLLPRTSDGEGSISNPTSWAGSGTFQLTPLMAGLAVLSGAGGGWGTGPISSSRQASCCTCHFWPCLVPLPCRPGHLHHAAPRVPHCGAGFK